ncbi:MAG: hypothetical protein IJN39_06360 [Clostridia bacterium]|nr:hypothetical protein [Clostridia bacterium]
MSVAATAAASEFIHHSLLIIHFACGINMDNVGQGLAPAEKEGTSKPVPYNMVAH